MFLQAYQCFGEADRLALRRVLFSRWARPDTVATRLLDDIDIRSRFLLPTRRTFLRGSRMDRWGTKVEGELLEARLRLGCQGGLLVALEA